MSLWDSCDHGFPMGSCFSPGCAGERAREPMKGCCHCNDHEHCDPARLGRCGVELDDGQGCGCTVDLTTPDPVDDYYKPLTREERDAAVRGHSPPFGVMLGWIRRWETTVRSLEMENLELGERVDNAKRVLDYSLVDEPDKQCDKLIWQANMNVHQILTAPMDDIGAMMTGITPKGLDSSGKLEIEIQINHHTGSVWISREFWDRMAALWGSPPTKDPTTDNETRGKCSVGSEQ